MKFRRQAVMGFLIVAGGLVAVAAEKESAASTTKVEQVRNVLPKATISPRMREVAGQLGKTMVFRDPVTGNLRAPEKGEHAALTARGGSLRVAAPTAVTVPGGGVALRVDTSRLEFMSVRRDAAGKLVHRCTNVSHPHAQRGGDSDEK